MVPLYYTDLRLRTETVVSATDASGYAGSISCSVGLSDRGREQVQLCPTGAYHVAQEELCIASPFDGIGAVRHAWSMLRLPCAAYLSWEIDKAACRVIRDRWPHVDELGDIRGATKEELRRLRLKYHRVKKVLLFPCFPCQGSSSLNSQGARRGHSRREVCCFLGDSSSYGTAERNLARRPHRRGCGERGRHQSRRPDHGLQGLALRCSAH